MYFKWNKWLRSTITVITNAVAIFSFDGLNNLFKPGPAVGGANIQIVHFLTTVISRRKYQWYTVSQLLLEHIIWQAWLLVFLPPKLSVVLNINILYQSKNYKNPFENWNFWGMWPLGHVGHVTYSFIKCCSYQREFLMISFALNFVGRHYPTFPFKVVWWRLLHKRIVLTKLDIYIFITVSVMC